MFRLTGPLAALVVCAFATSAAAQPSIPNITWDTNSPSSPGVGRIIGSGSYAITAAQTVFAVAIRATDSTDAKKSVVKPCQFDTTTKSWSGLIVGLPPGTYKVKATLIYNNGMFTLNQTVDSEEKTVTVPGP